MQRISWLRRGVEPQVPANTVMGETPQQVGSGLTIDSHILRLRVFHVLHQLLGQLLKLLYLLQSQRSWGPRGAHLKPQHFLHTLSRVTPS